MFPLESLPPTKNHANKVIQGYIYIQYLLPHQVKKNNDGGNFSLRLVGFFLVEYMVWDG